MISGGVWPGGICRMIVCAMAVTCATPPSTDAPGWRKILITPTPLNAFDSMCSMSLTVALSDRS